MADEFSELISDFGNDKKVKELAEIITGVVKIILNAVDMLEGRMNELDNRMKGLERQMNSRMDESRFSGSPETREERRKAPAFSDQDEPDYRPGGREPASYPRPSPAPAYGAPGGTATASGAGPGPAGGGGPMSARMQLQGELKELFSRMRARRG
ncbi:MAG: hypothetical protein QW279_03890 [Candidatus Jordarchaeaceae archaeon]